MHYKLEIIMPPTTKQNTEAQIAFIMAPYDENIDIPEDRDDDDALFEWASKTKQAFWDFYTIGGRFAGSKFKATLNQNKLKQFTEELDKQKITVSGIQCGKQALSPASQIPVVDKLWNEYFPGSGACQLFAHSNNQYDSGDAHAMDICTLDKMPHDYECEQVMIVTPQFDGALGVESMFNRSIWDGRRFHDTDWSGTVGEALDRHVKRIENYVKSFQDQNTPKDDWLCVTIDYHS